MAADLDRALVWFRRDLRLADHAALHHALAAARQVHCAFVFDREILDSLPEPADRRVEFIWESVAELKGALERHGGTLIVRHAAAGEAVPALARELGVAAVFANRDYEPQAVARDAAVHDALERDGIAFHTFKDQVIFEKDEVLTADGRPYSVFTPYRSAWLKKLAPFYLRAYPVEKRLDRLAPSAAVRLPGLEAMGFRRTNLHELGIAPGMSGAGRVFADFRKRMRYYHERRDYPALKGPSYLSVHLRFGTISIRELARAAHAAAGAGAQTWLNELVWREFYHQILWHYPHVVAGAFKREYDALRFPDDEGLWRAWCEGRTGYPLVDAAMRQLNQTGYMHNRLRMVAASFLVKDLLVDWRRGERYFAEKLNDFDLAANNGGWQWAASTGCDAQPYFRIFNPVSQSRKFDAEGTFIRKYVPELTGCDDDAVHEPWTLSPEAQRTAGVVIGKNYPARVVDHAVARKKALDLYAAVRRNR